MVFGGLKGKGRARCGLTAILISCIFVFGGGIHTLGGKTREGGEGDITAQETLMVSWSGQH